MGSKDKAEQTTHFESLSQAEVVEEIENKLFKKKLPFIKVHCFWHLDKRFFLLKWYIVQY